MGEGDKIALAEQQEKNSLGLQVCIHDGHGEWGCVVLGRVGAAEGQNRFNALSTTKCSAAPCG